VLEQGEDVVIGATDSTGRLSVAIVLANLNLRGGTHKQVQRLAEYLQRRGHSVAIHTHLYDPARCYAGIESLQVIATGADASEKPGAPEYLRAKWRWLARSWRLFASIPRDVDVINIHDPGCELVAVFARLLRRRARIIWQVNDLPYPFHVGIFSRTPDSFRNRMGRLFSRLCARACHRITVNVSKNKDLVEKCLGVTPEVVYPGVDMPNVSPPVRSHPSQPVELVSVGIVLPYRNYEAILEAQSILRRKHGISSRLRIVGSTDLSPAYTRTISDLIRKSGAPAELLGEISEPDLDRVYRQAGYFLFLNVDQSWGLAVFEAMNYRLPIIVSSSVGATELLTDNADAIIVDPANAESVADHVAVLQRDPAAYMALADRAYAAVSRMSWDSMYCSRIESRMLEATGRTKASSSCDQVTA
jgi:glycosyltransferase involved in cell wall biosynthesis